ncbi:MAG: AraC family transcriptional regulator ligand-binding domain-containing protein [Woeseiaceae bacterium]|nr:AraC family transcriptional regulator ligand-binding domain-containing protein [Woeseiaceae bacterium]
MGYISAMFAVKFAHIATAHVPSPQANRRALCQRVGIDADSAVDPKQMIRDTTFFGFLEHIAREYEHGRSVAIRVGASMRCDDYGAFGLAFKSAIDLWGSFQRVERYGKVVTSISNYVVEPGDESSFMALSPDDETRLGLRMTNELALAAATALSREVSKQPFSPVVVLLSHEEPDDLSAQEAHFRCPVHYGADRDGLEISDELLRAGNRLGDARISEFFDAHLEQELVDYSGDERLDERVRNQVAQSLSEGVPKIGEISARMGMSSRTLQRRLSAQGHVYQDLVDAARRELAETLLRQTEFSLAEIAFLTGYAEQSTFSRAFKRWYGQTPASYRRVMLTD